jgi:hypothetical protein
MSGNGQGGNGHSGNDQDGSDGRDGSGAERRGWRGPAPQGQATAPPLADWPHPVPSALQARMVVYLGLAVLGALAGTAGALVQSGWFPGGLVLALAGAVGLFWGGGKLCRTRVGAAAPGVGWVLTVLLLTSSRPEGDFLVGAGAGSYVFLLGGMLAAVMCATIALPAPPVPGDKYRR